MPKTLAPAARHFAAATTLLASALLLPRAHAVEVDSLDGLPVDELIDVLGTLPTYNNNGDTVDATFVADIDFDAKDAGNRELIWESGGGTIGWSICYEAPSTLVSRAAGNGGIDVATATYQLTQDQIDGGAIEVAWTFAVDDGAGLQVVAIVLDGVTVASVTHDLQPDWSGANGAAFGVASTALAAGGNNTSLTAAAFTSGLIDEVAGLRYYFDTYYVPAVDQTDTDGDGIPDAIETFYFPGDLDQLGPAPADFDNDGLADVDEITAGSNPTLADTDGDGRPDGDEVNGAVTSDPILADTDGDGLTDGQEVDGDPATNPELADSDNDFFDDLAEITQGSDPNDINDDPLTHVTVDSVTDWSPDGVQGENGWTYGFYDFSNDPDNSYTAEEFQPFFNEFGPGGGQVEPDGNHWSGTIWDMANASSVNGPAANVPWTTINSEQIHPNGTNNTVEHWAVRRYTAPADVARTSLLWHTREQNLAGGGVTGKLFVNGVERDTATIAGGDDLGVYRRLWIDLKAGDVVDLALTPHGPNDGGNDGSDGSFNWLRVDARPFTDIAALPRQPDGSLFVPENAEDTDTDNLWDSWELAFFPGDLTAMDDTTNSDGDALSDAEEFENDADPTDADTDDDLLDDAAEVAAGSDPRNPDTDGDGLTDHAEVTGVPATDPTKADSDDDGYPDPQELALGSDPNDPGSNLDDLARALWLADTEPEPLGDTFGDDGGIAPTGLNPPGSNGLMQPYGNGVDGLPQVVDISAAGATQTGRARAVDFAGGLTNQRLRIAAAPDSIAELFTTAATTAPGTIEIVLSPDSLDGFNQTVWESGGTGDGHGIYLIGKDLYGAVNDGNAAPTGNAIAGPVDLTPLYETFSADDYLLVRVVFEPLNQITLGVTHLGTDRSASATAAWTGDSWDGGDNMSLGYFQGTRGGDRDNQVSNLPDSSTAWDAFDGQAASLAFYDRAVDATTGNPVDPGPGTPFVITSVERDAITGELTLTWTSSPGETFTIASSADGVTWVPAPGTIAASAGATTQTTIPSSPFPTVLLRVERQ